MSQSERSLRDEDTRALVRIARQRAKAQLIEQVKALQVETTELQRIANRLTDIATAIAVANGVEKRVNKAEGEGED
jgi:hypothetical protein